MALTPVEIPNDSILQPVQARTAPPGGRTQPTPMELQQMYNMSKALMGDKVPPRNWWQGANNALGDIMGGYMFGQAQRSGRIPEALSLNQTGGFQQAPAPVKDNQSDAPSTTKSASREGAENAKPTGGSDDLMERAAKATSIQESGGNYGEIGVPTRYGRALGKYQIVSQNVGPWSQEILGRKLTPQQFLNDPAAQDAIYKGKMGNLIAKYGVENAGRAWLGGEGAINKPERRDALGTSVQNYGRRFASLVEPNAILRPPLPQARPPFIPQPDFTPPNVPMAAAGGAQVASLDPSFVGGGTTGQKPPVGAPIEPGPMAAATPAPTPPTGPVLAANTGARPAATATPQTAAPSPFSSTVTVPKGVLGPSSTFTPDQIRGIMHNQFLDPNIKAMLLQQYYGTQVNPRTIPMPGVGNIVVPPGTSKGYVMPDVRWIKEGAEGATTETPTWISPGGVQQFLPMQGGGKAGSTPAPQGGPPISIGPGAVPSTAPTPAPTAPPAPAPATPPSIAAPPPVAPQSVVPPTPDVPPNMGALPPTNKVASADASFIPKDLPPQPTGPAATPADAVAKAQASMLTGPVPSIGGKPTQTADISPRLQELSDFGLQQAHRKELNQKDADQFVKNVQTYGDTGNRAGKSIGNLDMAAKMVQDPRFYSGPFADIAKTWQQLRAVLGKDPNMAAPMEIFDKIMAGTAVTELKTQLQGLGQVRVAEINLINNSLANRYNTPQANLAVLNIMKRVYQQTDNIGKISTAYSQGWRWDANGKPYFSNENPTNAGLLDTINKYEKNNPLFRDSEIQNYNATFNMASNSGKAVRQQKFTPLTEHDVGPQVQPSGVPPAPPPAPTGPTGPAPTGLGPNPLGIPGR